MAIVNNPLNMEQILQLVYQEVGQKLRVDASGATITANIDGVTIDPPTDFRPKTYTVSNTPQSITFGGGFNIKGLIIKTLNTNPGYIRIGKANVFSTTDEFYLQSPGESLNVPLDVNTTAIYFVNHPGETAGTYKITVMAVNA
jgi:hypothetical protein